jgi:hypothetical protein
MATHTPRPPHKKMQDYRTRLRASGLRPVQIWVPDTRTAHFAKEARRQSLLVSRQKLEEDILDFIESVADLSQDP